MMRTFGVPQVSTGDLLREHVKSGSALGHSAKSLMDRGLLVPDELVNDMVAERLARPGCRRMATCLMDFRGLRRRRGGWTRSLRGAVAWR